MNAKLESMKPETEAALLETVAQIEPANANDVLQLLDTTAKGLIRNTLSNAVKILHSDPLFRGHIKYNLLSQRVDIVKDLGWKRNTTGAAMTDNDLHNIHLKVEQIYGLSSLKLIDEALQIVANDEAYHPIVDYLDGLTWDGQERIRHALHHFLGAEENEYTFEVLKLFMLGAISRVYKPGTKFDYTICIVGDQGSGKSSFFRLMAIKDEWFTDDLKDLESGNVYEKLQGHWIVELSEMLATTSAKSNEVIKSFLTRQVDTYRTPYERNSKDRARQCVFAGTTNRLAFLPNDRTGNRRLLPILCSAKDAEVFILDDEASSREYIKQMWAEAMTLWRSGASLKLSPEVEKMVLQEQLQFMQEDADSGLILAYMDTFQGNAVCARQLFKEVLHPNDRTEPQRYQLNDINEIVNQLIRRGDLKDKWKRFSNPRSFGLYGRQKGWIKELPGNDTPTTTQGFIPLQDDEAPEF